MLAEQRRKRILHEVQTRGAVHVQELTELFEVSAMTVRRDLRALQDRGLLTRVHGGAEPTGSGLEPTFAEKAALHAEQKTVIAARAATLVAPGAAVSFSAGTTCVRVAQMLTRPGGPAHLSVVTDSLPVAEEFYRVEQGSAPHPTPDQGIPVDAPGAGSAALPRPARVLLTGGQRTPSDALVGPLADAALAELHTDLLFLGAHGVGPEGLTTPNPEEARTNRALIRATGTVVAVFDASKWGVTGLAGFADWGAVDVVVTDAGLPRAAKELLEERVDEVIIAS